MGEKLQHLIIWILKEQLTYVWAAVAVDIT